MKKKYESQFLADKMLNNEIKRKGKRKKQLESIQANKPNLKPSHETKINPSKTN